MGKDIFGDNDRLEPYYTAALALYRLEDLFRNGSLDSKYKPARYHALLAFRLIVNHAKRPAMSSHEMSRYCQPLMERLWDAANAETVFQEAMSVVDVVAKGNLNRDYIRTSTFTDSLLAHCKKGKGSS